MQETKGTECPACQGIGLVRIETRDSEGKTRWVSRACECQENRSRELRWAAAMVPERYRHCVLESFNTEFDGIDRSLKNAFLLAKRFVNEYPVDTGGKGLLLVGDLGTGKTHLAVGILHKLIYERGSVGMFCDYRDLLKRIQNSYNSKSSVTEYELLEPLMDVEILLLDDLGAVKPSDWVWDMAATILNARYNSKKTTIITTNYLDEPAGKGNLSDVERAARELTLGDRIGDRMLSRLAEMCLLVSMSGKDFRKSVKRANFAR